MPDHIAIHDFQPVVYSNIFLKWLHCQITGKWPLLLVNVHLVIQSISIENLIVMTLMDNLSC